MDGWMDGWIRLKAIKENETEKHGNTLAKRFSLHLNISSLL